MPNGLFHVKVPQKNAEAPCNSAEAPQKIPKRWDKHPRAWDKYAEAPFARFLNKFFTFGKENKFSFRSLNQNFRTFVPSFGIVIVKILLI